MAPFFCCPGGGIAGSMVEDIERGSGEKADGDAIARAHAVYTLTALRFYDVVVHGLSNRIAWRCPTSRVVSLYENNLSASHLEAGVGTGLLVDRAGSGFGRLVLADINQLPRSGGAAARPVPASARSGKPPRATALRSRALRFGGFDLCAALPAGQHGEEA